EGEHHDVGIIVDAVNEVMEIPPADIEPPPTFGTQLRTDFIAGMGKLDGKFVIVLNAEQVLCLEELSVQAAQIEPLGPQQ
ncbi:MAG: chemotaxis protein CheW, partial [Rhodocyclaceae bacterium]